MTVVTVEVVKRHLAALTKFFATVNGHLMDDHMQRQAQNLQTKLESLQECELDDKTAIVETIQAMPWKSEMIQRFISTIMTRAEDDATAVGKSLKFQDYSNLHSYFKQSEHDRLMRKDIAASEKLTIIISRPLQLGCKFPSEGTYGHFAALFLATAYEIQEAINMSAADKKVVYDYVKKLYKKKADAMTLIGLPNLHYDPLWASRVHSQIIAPIFSEETWKPFPVPVQVLHEIYSGIPQRKSSALLVSVPQLGSRNAFELLSSVAASQGLRVTVQKQQPELEIDILRPRHRSSSSSLMELSASPIAAGDSGTPQNNLRRLSSLSSLLSESDSQPGQGSPQGLFAFLDDVPPPMDAAAPHAAPAPAAHRAELEAPPPAAAAPLADAGTLALPAAPPPAGLGTLAPPPGQAGQAGQAGPLGPVGAAGQAGKQKVADALKTVANNLIVKAAAIGGRKALKRPAAAHAPKKAIDKKCAAHAPKKAIDKKLAAPAPKKALAKKLAAPDRATKPSMSVEWSRKQVMLRTGQPGPGQTRALIFKDNGGEKAAIAKGKAWLKKQLKRA